MRSMLQNKNDELTQAERPSFHKPRMTIQGLRFKTDAENKVSMKRWNYLETSILILRFLIFSSLINLITPSILSRFTAAYDE